MVYWKGIVVTFTAYVSVHAGRKAFTNTKAIVLDLLGIDATVGGTLDAVFMLAYAVGLVRLGGLGDRMRDPTDLLVVSLAAMSVLQITFALLCLSVASSVWGLILLFLVWIANGLVQSLAWPCCVKLVGLCLSSGSNSTVFSIWACNGIVGNICCSLIAALVLDNFENAKIGFLAVFIITSLGNLLAIGWLKTCRYPESLHLDDIEEHENMSLSTCLGLTGVIDYSLCHACVKGVAYAMFFWLPFYLVKVHKVSPGIAAATTIWYDLATVLGGPLCGYLVQKTNKPAIVITIFVLLAAGPQFCIDQPDDDYYSTGLLRPDASIPNLVLANIVLSGFLVGGVLNVLSAAVCAKLGGLNHTSMVTGVIDGLGSLGASATQVVIPLIGVDFDDDWTDVFALLGCMLIGSAATLFRITRDEFKPSSNVEYQIQQ